MNTDTAAPSTPAAVQLRGIGRLRSLGPGAVVAAAFIGPGTVTTATLAGVRYGYALLWALTFSTLATVILQEMSARLGLVTGVGLGEAVRRRFDGRVRRLFAVMLILSAVAFGNAAYEAGNLLGTALGAEAVLGGGVYGWAIAAAGIACVLLWSGSYRLVERVLVGLVALMSLVFLATAIVSSPPPATVLRGLFIPSLPPGAGGLLVAVGLIGTTVVPYNLFLHAAAVTEKWAGPESIATARLDLVVSIVMGGIVSMAIVVTSAAAHGAEPANAADMAVQLEPLLGSWARFAFAVGLLAAGLSSAITAPLAAAYATAGALGWPRELKDRRLRAVWLAVLAAGVLSAVSGIRPVQAILFAQVANGVLLPAIAIFLLIAANDRRHMGRWSNGVVLNILGVLVVLAALGLGAKAVLGAWR